MVRIKENESQRCPLELAVTMEMGLWSAASAAEEVNFKFSFNLTLN